MLGGGGSVAVKGLMYICWTGLWFAPLMYVTCVDMWRVWGVGHAHGRT